MTADWDNMARDLEQWSYREHEDPHNYFVALQDRTLLVAATLHLAEDCFTLGKARCLSTREIASFSCQGFMRLALEGVDPGLYSLSEAVRALSIPREQVFLAVMLSDKAKESVARCPFGGP